VARSFSTTVVESLQSTRYGNLLYLFSRPGELTSPYFYAEDFGKIYRSESFGFVIIYVPYTITFIVTVQ
jgi:hypothetical protein